MRISVRETPYALFSALAAAGLSLLFVPPAEARDLPPGALGGTGKSVDIVVGQNKPGPYTLGWNHLQIDWTHAVSVNVDGVTLPDDGFTVDGAKGTVNFSTPLKNTSVARVTYSYMPGIAKRNADFSQAPITVPLLRSSDLNLQVTALPSAANGMAGETRLVYSLERKLGLLGGGLTSKALVGDGGTALNFGYKYGGDQNGFNAGFARTERDFASRVGKAVNLSDAVQKLTMGAHLRPSRYFGVGMTMSDNHDLVASGNKAQQALSVNLGGGASVPALNYTRSDDKSTTAKHDVSDVSSDKVDLKAALGSGAALTGNAEKIVTNAPGVKNDTTAQNATLGLAASTKDKKSQISLSVTDTQKQSATSDDTSQGLLLKVQPVTALTVSAEQKDQKATAAGKDGATSSASQTNLSLQFHPVSSLTVFAEQKEQVTTPGGKSANADATQTDVSVKFKPVAALTVSAEQKQQKEQKTMPDGTVAGVATDASQTALAAEVIPLPSTKLTGSVQTTTLGDVHTSVTDIGAQLGTGRAVEIGGGVTNRSTSAAATVALDTTRAQVALRPLGSAFTLTGGYIWNPEKDGKVSQAMRQEVGVKAHMGALDVGSGYALTTMNGLSLAGDAPDPQFGEVSVTLGLKFSKFTTLKGNYKDSLLYGGAEKQPASLAPRGFRVYGFGLSHSLGSALNISMDGSSSDDKSLATRKNDFKAEAKIGAKF